MNCGLIVVLFNPDIAHVQGIIDGFADPQWRIYLVDNSPIAHQFNLPAQAEYLHLPNNEGIAKAQNEGLKRAFDCVDYAFYSIKTVIFLLIWQPSFSLNLCRLSAQIL